MPTLLNKTSLKPTDFIKTKNDENPVELDYSLHNKQRCPCCSDILLRHIDSHGIYWYCSHCRQKMPILN